MPKDVQAAYDLARNSKIDARRKFLSRALHKLFLPLNLQKIRELDKNLIREPVDILYGGGEIVLCPSLMKILFRRVILLLGVKILCNVRGWTNIKSIH